VDDLNIFIESLEGVLDLFEALGNAVPIVGLQIYYASLKGWTNYDEIWHRVILELWIGDKLR
jgi:hypothetical protein